MENSPTLQSPQPASDSAAPKSAAANESASSESASANEKTSEGAAGNASGNANKNASGNANGKKPSKAKAFDMLTLLMLAVFSINLLLYLGCQHSHLAKIDQRDRRTNAAQRHARRGPGDSRTAERERLRRGEAEQELRDPNKPAGQDRGAEPNADSGEWEDEGSDGPPPPDNGHSIGWLSQALNKPTGQEALQSLADSKGSLALTDRQKELLLKPKDKNSANINELMNNVLNILRPDQMRYLLEKKEIIDGQSVSPISTSAMVDSTIQKLSRIKGTSMQSRESFHGDRGIWSPKPIAIGISLLADSAEEECRLNETQAQELIKALRAMDEADRILQHSNEYEQLEEILTEEQIEYLFDKLKDDTDDRGH
ncbi:hypothetical protein IJT17_07555 [bacterium]|nr:hypothetical protein [bacterium]